MKAEELRIGNYLTSEINPLVNISALHILSIAEGNEEFKPIPLNEEWLIKAGFQKDEQGWFNIHFKIEGFAPNSFSVNVNSKATSICSHTNAYEGVISYVKQIEYVHQLQNLYFSLTGEELPINL
jgi:hypothetical protein